MNKERPIVIIGGLGVVGRELIKLIRIRHPNLPIALGSRSPEKGLDIQKEIKTVEIFPMDVNIKESIANIPASALAIINSVNDDSNFILDYAMNHSIPYVDITRWIEPMISAINRIEQFKPKSPVLLSSSWMGGVVAIVGKYLLDSSPGSDSVNVDILYSLTDKSGPNSVEFMDQFHKSFIVIENSEKKRIKPMQDRRKVNFSRFGNFTTYQFGTPEQYTIPLSLGIKKVTSRISFDSRLLTSVFALLVRTGIWKLFSSNRFTRLRRALLYNPGEGGNAVIMVEVNGNSSQKRIMIVDRFGQFHLTAVGALISLERVLGLDGNDPPHGLVFPEEAPDAEKLISTMKDCGVELISNP